MDNSLTPVRVRGKGYAPEQQRLRAWKHEYNAKHKQAAAKAADGQAEGVFKRAKRSHLSRLEQLPTELIEIIFLYSANVDMPLTSRTLQAQLSHKHLQLSLTDNVLHVLLRQKEDVSSAELQHAQILLERRFLSWSVFQQWLVRQAGVRYNDVTALRERAKKIVLPSSDEEWFYAALLRSIGGSASHEIHIPERALSSPWTNDRARLLIFWAFFISLTRDLCSISPDQSERIYDGLVSALEQRAVACALALIPLIRTIDDALIEQAVIVGGCERSVLDALFTRLNRVIALQRKVNTFNPRNPVLWQWADQPPQIESGDGEFLKAKLRMYMQFT